MQSYTVVSMHVRTQMKMLYVWYLKKQGDWDTIHKKNDIIEMLEEVARKTKTEETTKTGQRHLFGNEKGTSESLQDSVVTKLLQDS